MILYNTLVQHGHILGMKDFESEEQAVEENRVRYKKLYEQGSPECRVLADKLWDCSEREIRCGSAACKICSRDFRVHLVETLVDTLGPMAEDYAFVTFVFYDSVVSHCDAIKVKDIKGRLWKQIQRAKVEGAVIGAFEMDFEPKERLWYPHYHLLMPKGSALELCKSRFGKNQKDACKRRGKQKRPFREDSINNPVEQMSYIFKYMWQQLSWSGRGRKRRLPDNQFCEYLSFVDSHDHSKLMLLYKARLEGGVLKIK